MFSIRKAILALVVGVAVTIGCYLIGAILVSVSNDATNAVTTTGNWLKTYGSLIGLLCAVWYYFTTERVNPVR